MKAEQIRMCNAHGIPVIKSEKARQIIDKREPVGFFIEETDYGFTGIDNQELNLY